MTDMHCATFATELGQWLKDTPSLSTPTVAAYRGEINRLAEAMTVKGIRTVSSMSLPDWDEYLTALTNSRSGVVSRRRKGLKITSALQAARITRSFLRYCWRQGWIKWVPGLDPRKCAVPRNSSQSQLPKEVAQLLTSPPTGDEEAARSHCAMSLAFWGAMKPREIASLRCGDLFLAPNGLTALLVAGRHSRVVLPKIAVEHINHYHHLRQLATHVVAVDNSPLISHLASYERLSDHRVWSLLKYLPTRTPRGQESQGVGARLLRESFASIATVDALSELNAIWQQCSRAVVFAHSRSAGVVEVLPSAILDRVSRELLTSSDR